MVHCSCGKPIEKIPIWLSRAKVDFICNNCPNRQTKNIAHVSIAPETPVLPDVEELDELDGSAAEGDSDESGD